MKFCVLMMCHEQTERANMMSFRVFKYFNIDKKQTNEEIIGINFEGNN